MAQDTDEFRRDGDGYFRRRLSAYVDPDGRMDPVEKIFFESLLLQEPEDMLNLGPATDHPNVGGITFENRLETDAVVGVAVGNKDQIGIFVRSYFRKNLPVGPADDAVGVGKTGRIGKTTAVIHHRYMKSQKFCDNGKGKADMPASGDNESPVRLKHFKKDRNATAADAEPGFLVKRIGIKVRFSSFKRIKGISDNELFQPSAADGPADAAVTGNHHLGADLARRRPVDSNHCRDDTAALCPYGLKDSVEELFHAYYNKTMVSCILLAAGSSSRFGSPKPLARAGGATVIEHIQRTLLSARITETIVVLGAEADAISARIIFDERIRYVVNAGYALGQTHSFKTGLSFLRPDATGIMLLPVDVPFIKKETLDLLIDVFLKKHPPIALPTYHGSNGHPPIFSADLLEELRSLKNEEPIFGVQRRHEQDILKVPVDDEGVVLSFNTPEEFKEIEKNLNGQGPT